MTLISAYAMILSLLEEVLGGEWVLKEIVTSPLASPLSQEERARASLHHQQAQLLLIPRSCFLLSFISAVEKLPFDIKEGKPTRNYYYY